MRSFHDIDAGFSATGPRGALAPSPSDTIDARVLAAGAAELHQIPAGARIVVFSSIGDFFAKFGISTVTAAVPSADVTDGSAPELNPAARRIPADATHIALVAPAAATVVMSFYGA